MTKGFGKQPDFTRIQRLLAKAIASQNLSQLEALVVKFGKVYGRERIVDTIVSDVLPQCSVVSLDWFWQSILPADKYAEFIDKGRSRFYRSLIEQGFQPGKDFSSGSDSGFIVSPQVREKLLEFVPEEHRASIEAEMPKSNLAGNAPWTSLEKHLGVPFFENLLERVKSRYGEFIDNEYIVYALLMCYGFGARHPEMEEDFFLWLLGSIIDGHEHLKPLATKPDTIPEMEEARLSDINERVIEDLIVAAGGADCIKTFDDGYVGISRDGIKILAELWRGDLYSPYELIAAMDRHLRK